MGLYLLRYRFILLVDIIMDGVEDGAITKRSAGDQDRKIDTKTILVKGDQVEP